MNAKACERFGTAAWLGVLALELTACSVGGDSEPNTPSTGEGGSCFETTIENCGPGPWDPFGIALLFAWAGGQCTKEVQCATKPAPSDLTAGIVTGELIRSNWSRAAATEVEPNDGPAEAMPRLLQADRTITVTGVVNDSGDAVDFVAFAARSVDGTVGIHLCRAVGKCAPPFLQSDEIYIELVDQTGNVMQTTDMMQTSNGHEIVFLPSQGLGYFVAVRARDTGRADFEYQLEITD